MLLTGFVSAGFTVPFVSFLVALNFIPSAANKKRKKNTKEKTFLKSKHRLRCAVFWLQVMPSWSNFTKVCRCDKLLNLLIIRVIYERCESVPVDIEIKSFKCMPSLVYVDELKSFNKLLAFGCLQTVSIRTLWRAEWQRTGTSRKHLLPTTQSNPLDKNRLGFQ